MSEQQYADIATACDRLLRAPQANLARLAIPALHFLNEHPSSLAQYAPLLTEHSEGVFSDISKAVIRAARGLARSCATLPSIATHERPIDVLIVSHLLNPGQLRQENDFYFGALQSLLQDRGVTSLLVLINHLRDADNSEVTQPHPSPRMILPRSVPLGVEANIWRQCANAWRALRREAAGTSNSGDGELALLASRQALSVSAAMNLRMHASLAKVCQSIDPKVVITTYEGTVAERLIWHAARTARRRPLCVGYQHAMMLERAHAIRRPVAAPGIECDPEVILTLGQISHAALAASPELKAVRLIEYGSHRRAELPELPLLQDRPHRCLVLPDANFHECATLFDFALACARQRSEISFALRPHPMVDTRSLLERHPDLQKLPANVSLSVSTPLERELAQARYCLYRGSSAAMYAVRAGIKPYYLARSGELPVDCLFQLANWRETVTSPEDLLARIAATDPITDSAAASHAMSVCERYVSPVRPAAIDELLAMVAA
jgi:hypothetical protein